jgi:hypothetical protein
LFHGFLLPVRRSVSFLEPSKWSRIAYLFHHVWKYKVAHGIRMAFNLMQILYLPKII